MTTNPSSAPDPESTEVDGVQGPSGEHHDVIIIGAGLSGVGAAYRLQTERPGTSYAILEAREELGGTWDLFRYPGVRSDSDMYTLGYAFKPWTDSKSLADGSTVLDYIRETAAEFGIGPHIQRSSRVVGTNFDTATARWTLTVEDPRTAVRRTMTCGFLYCCSGYYDYEHPHDPGFAGAQTFTGTIVHPQFWPANLDHSGQRVVVIGSGATAVTLVPALLDGETPAEHVTMLQRSPTWIAAVPGRDRLAEQLKAVLPAGWAHRVIRAKNIGFGIAFYQYCRRRPASARKLLTGLASKVLGDSQLVTDHFTPSYNPWDQRLCAIPGGDLFHAITSGNARVVTDRIDRFVPEGILLTSGEVLEADLIVTATGLQLLAFGGIEPHVDGKKVVLSEQYVWNGAMLTGIPNFAVCIGYTNASWTLRADLTHRLVAKILVWMDEKHHAAVVPRPGSDLAPQPLLDLSSGYVQRSLGAFPRQGDRRPWLVRQNYVLDTLSTMRTDLDRTLIPTSTGATSTAATWSADILGTGYEQHTFELGPDPDGETEIAAVLVRRTPAKSEPVNGAVLYVHGFSDYFFQTDLADFFAARGLAFYALDLRKCGRSRRPGQTPHYCSDLNQYDTELDRSLDLIAAEHPDQPVTIVAHSTGGLIAPLYLDRRRRAGRTAPITGLVLNSPWFDLQGKPVMRGPVTWVLRAVARVRPFRALDLPTSIYGDTLHLSGTGEWDFNVDLKPLAGFPVTVGWLNAVRRGHAQLHRGLDVGVPSLVLRSDRSHFSGRYSDAIDRADNVLDVDQIARWSGCLGGETTIAPVTGARHDVFLSLPDSRKQAYELLDAWLQRRS